MSDRKDVIIIGAGPVAEVRGHDDRGMLMQEVFAYDIDKGEHRDLRAAT